MNDATNRLLLCALQRAGNPLDSGNILDAAVGLGLNEGWRQQDLPVNRQAVATRLTKMVEDGFLSIVGQVRDAVARRDTPTYEPVAGWDAHAPVPGPDRAARSRTGADESPYASMTPRQRIAIFEAQDIVLDSLSRLLQQLQVGLADMAQAREKARQRLMAEGLEAR